MKNGQVALALVGGYALGRAHKMRWALALAGMAAGSRLRPGSGAGSKLLESPEINKLTQTVRSELLSAGKTAAVAAAGSRIDSLSDRMQRRASSLRAGPEAEKPEDPEDDEEEPRDEEEEEGEEEEEEPAEDEKEEPAEEATQRERGRPARTRAPSSKGGRTRTPATRPTTDKKKTSASSSKSASRKTATGRRTTSSGSSGSGGSARRDRG